MRRAPCALARPLAPIPWPAQAFDADWMLRPHFAPHWLLNENLQLQLTVDRALRNAAAEQKEAEQAR